MHLTVHILPARTDNYIYVLACPNTKHAVVIDPGWHAPVEETLATHNLQLTAIWLTHHHDDHVHAAETLRAQYAAKIIGFSGDSHGLPSLNVALHDGESFVFAGHEVRVRHIPGHTLGHVLYYLPGEAIAFVGDTLFAMGCGRMFEGDAATFYSSLRIIASLPLQTQLYAGHEYSVVNAQFAAMVEAENHFIRKRLQCMQQLRQQQQPSLPTTVGDELASNPFLRTQSAAIRRYMGVADTASDITVFAALRALKDQWSPPA
jgi:hydroxyacylglutathione hydrolase